MAGGSGGHQSYYVPEQSKFPFLATLGLVAAILGTGFTLNSHTFDAGAKNPAEWLLPIGFVFFILVLWNWFATTIRENLAGLNSEQLKKSYVLGMQWFIFSEVMFFGAFFTALWWARAHSVPELGSLENALLWPDFKAVWPSAASAAGATASPAGQRQSTAA